MFYWTKLSHLRPILVIKQEKIPWQKESWQLLYTVKRFYAVTIERVLDSINLAKGSINLAKYKKIWTTLKLGYR